MENSERFLKKWETYLVKYLDVSLKRVKKRVFLD